MTAVKDELPELMSLLFVRLRGELDALTTGGLRVSHLRVVSSVPPQGASVTALADRLGMTKQGCGQFVAQLASSGYLRTESDPDDARVRKVVRTPTGQALVDELDRLLSDVEGRYTREVGARRYATFRQVLAQLATPGADTSVVS